MGRKTAKSIATFSIRVAGDPTGASRPRVTRRGTFYPAKHKRWERNAELQARIAHKGPPLEGPLAVEIVAVHERPKAHRKSPNSPRTRIWAPKVPDADNIAKLCMDALQKAGVFKNDSQVCSLFVVTEYGWLGKHEPGGCTVWEPPSTTIRVWPIEEGP